MQYFFAFLVVPLAAPLIIAAWKSVRLALTMIVGEIALLAAMLVTAVTDPYRLSALLAAVLGSAFMVGLLGLHKLARYAQARSDSVLLTLLAGRGSER